MYVYVSTYIHIHTGIQKCEYTYIAKATSRPSSMKVGMKTMKVKVVKKPAGKSMAAPAKSRKTASATSKMGDREAANLR